MRRWDVDPDRHSPDTRPEDCYDLVYEDDRSDFILSGLLHREAEHIAATHNAEVDSLPTRDARVKAEALRGASSAALICELADRIEAGDTGGR